MKRVLIINTAENKSTAERIGRELESRGKNFEVIYANDLNIKNCMGCNFCWLKTPGTCVIKDDYEEVLKKMHDSDQVWLVSDNSFGFVTSKTKNIVDRVMPLVTMNLHMSNGQMRHIMRYENNPDWGVVFCGEGNRKYLKLWCERVALNFGTKSLGVFSKDELQEVIACIQ